MKKILLLMALTLPFVLISCGDDKDEPAPPDSDEWVDLGLPSGTLWATCNIGAEAPEEYGDYFAWGETSPKDWYDWGTYKWSRAGTDAITKYCKSSLFGDVTDGKTELDPEDDAAYVNWGPQWRMPTKAQLDELLEQCTWTWTTQNGVNGYLVTGPNGNSIFLPAAGSRWQDYLPDEGSYCGYYWLRTLYTGSSCYAYGLDFKPNYVNWSSDFRDEGLSVRAVRVPQN